MKKQITVFSGYKSPNLSNISSLEHLTYIVAYEFDKEMLAFSYYVFLFTKIAWKPLLIAFRMPYPSTT